MKTPVGVLSPRHESDVTYRIYYDTREEREDVPDLLSRIAEFKFRELTADGDEELSFGWTCYGKPLSTDFLISEVRGNGLVRLTMRTDRWSLNRKRLKSMYQQALERYQEEHGTTVKFIPRTTKDAILGSVQLGLRRQSLPSMSTVDVIWNTDEGRVRVFSQERKLSERFLELWEGTFGFMLLPSTPYTRAINLDEPLSDEAIGQISAIEAWSLV